MTLYRKPSLLRDWLTCYKPGEEGHRPEYCVPLGILLRWFFAEHGGRLREEFGGFDAVCIVPSTTREPPHPLAGVYERSVDSGGAPLVTPLRRGNVTIDRRAPVEGGFIVIEPVAARRILLLDDVFTTGARAQTAACALLSAGAVVPAIVVIARRFNPDYHEAVAAIWQRQAATPYDFSNPPWDAASERPSGWSSA